MAVFEQFFKMLFQTDTFSHIIPIFHTTENVNNPQSDCFLNCQYIKYIVE